MIILYLVIFTVYFIVAAKLYRWLLGISKQRENWDGELYQYNIVRAITFIWPVGIPLLMVAGALIIIFED